MPTMTSRRSLVREGLESIGVPLLVAVVGAYVTTRMTLSEQDRHDISVSISRSDNGTEDTYPSPFEGGDPFSPAATPGIPASEFSYTGLVRNNGDFSEEDVIVQFWFEIELGQTQAIAGVSFDASSTLLHQSILPSQSPQTQYHFQLRVPRMNPGEWISISARACCGLGADGCEVIDGSWLLTGRPTRA
jgi:hypothetical protein